jgi:hypothetical protein
MRAMKDIEDMEAKPEKSTLDYTILRVVVITLSLVLLLQLLRHKLDASSKRMPLFKTVLEGVYEECKSLITCDFLLIRLLMKRIDSTYCEKPRRFRMITND